MDSDPTPQSAARHVFISFAHADEPTARFIAHLLEEASIPVWREEQHLLPRQDVAGTIRHAVKKSDTAVLLLSPAVSDSPKAQREQSAIASELDRRGIDVIPALVAPYEVPNHLKQRGIVDLTGPELQISINRLIKRIREGAVLDLARLTPALLESLVRDLLLGLGLRVGLAARGGDEGFDFSTTSEADVLGLGDSRSWLVQVKHHKSERVSLDAIRDLTTTLERFPEGTSALLITSGHLTSIAQKYLADLELPPEGEIRVIDGTRLKQLVSQQPGLISDYFAFTDPAGGGTLPDVNS